MRTRKSIRIFAIWEIPEVFKGMIKCIPVAEDFLSSIYRHILDRKSFSNSYNYSKSFCWKFCRKHSKALQDSYLSTLDTSFEASAAVYCLLLFGATENRNCI